MREGDASRTRAGRNAAIRANLSCALKRENPDCHGDTEAQSLEPRMHTDKHGLRKREMANTTTGQEDSPIQGARCFSFSYQCSSVCIHGSIFLFSFMRPG